MTIRKPKHMARRLATGLLATAVAGALWVAAHPESDVAATNANYASPAATPASAVIPTTGQPSLGNTPPDVPAAEWSQVQASLRATPNGEKDLPRVGEYLTFQHRVALWQRSKQEGMASSSRAAWGSYLLDTLPTHLARGEVTAFEARTLETELLQDSINDPALLQRALKQEDQRLLVAEPRPDPVRAADEQARLASYKKHETDITAQWMAMTPATRDPKWLEAQLDAARQQAFDGTNQQAP